MKIIFIVLFLLTLVVLPHSRSFAGVAEASTVQSGGYLQNYDLSDLSTQERYWFIKFIEGTFFADGWQEIADDILGKLPDELRQKKEHKLNQLGTKIGREWCKDNDVRKIDTDMLKEWGYLLKETAQDDPHLLANVIEHIDGEVNALID